MTAVLGIESTAHTFGVAVVRNGKVLSNTKKSYTTEKGGIIPVEAARHHEKFAEEIFNEALSRSGIDSGKIDAIAFSQGPGLSPCLLVGLKKTKSWASRLKIPVIPVNHCIAH